MTSFVLDDCPLRYVKGVGPKKEAIFNELGVYTGLDLLYYFPSRYEDRTNLKKISALTEEEPAVLRGQVVVCNLKKIPYYVKTRRVRSIFEVVVRDETGLISCVWFNRDYMAQSITKDMTLVLFGKPIRKGKRWEMVFPEYEVVTGQDPLMMGKIVGKYRLRPPLRQNFMRKLTVSLLEQHKGSVPEPLPFSLRKEFSLANMAQALEGIHFPRSWEDLASARQRFVFEELFFSQIMVYLRKAKHRLQESIPLSAPASLQERILKNLCFTLTADQQTVVDQLIADLAKPYPMHRLLQGDVGCGKTVVAAFGMGIAVEAGAQVAFMVPTEVLAQQHLQTLQHIFKGFGYTIRLLTASVGQGETKQILEGLAMGKINIVVGTHSLLRETVMFKNVGFVVIDEQHKFGVGQRALLPKKGVPSPHCLVMSATPIPRTLALSLYGDLDLSVIKELPQGRKIPKTLWVKEKRRAWVYDLVKDELAQGRQAYIVFPVIEETEDEDIRSLEEMEEKITVTFKPYTVGAFHGRMKPKEKQETVKRFSEGTIHILVATTIVEVGVNIENATVMVVESPQRFGLAQLHQLRGRIQRSSYQPHFILISGDRLSDLAQRRLEAISQTTDGFAIAEADLELRGPGDFFGYSQHGVPLAKIADPRKDTEILQQARGAAYKVIKRDPSLESSAYRCIRNRLDFWFKK